MNQQLSALEHNPEVLKQLKKRSLYRVLRLLFWVLAVVAIITHVNTGNEYPWLVWVFIPLILAAVAFASLARFAGMSALRAGQTAAAVEASETLTKSAVTPPKTETVKKS